jgi:hypothetical protein
MSPFLPPHLLPLTGDQRPRIVSVPEHLSSAGADAVELAGIAGLVMDPWETFVLDEAMGMRPDGTWSAFEVGLVVSRQNGKGCVLEARELASLYLLDEELCIHSAHQFDTSLEHFNRVLGLIESTPDLDRKVSRVSRSHGDEGIEVYRDGALRRLRFRTRTKGGGRGFTCDCLILDEAMALVDSTVGAILPTLSAVPNPQVWYTGSAGTRESTALGRVRARGVAGSDPRLCFMEWSIDWCTAFCPKPCYAHDPQKLIVTPDMDTEQAERQKVRLVRAYARANPGFGIRIGGVLSPEKSVEHIESERRTMSGEEFARERLGVGDWPVEGDSWRVIDQESWKACRDVLSSPVGPVAFGIDMTPDRKMACITVAALNEDGMTHVEITSADVLDHRSGDRWVVPRLLELVERWKPCAVVIDKASQAGSLIKSLEDHQVEVTSPTGRQFAQACGWFGGAVVPVPGQAPMLAHLDQVPLTAAVAGADRRKLAELWAWDKVGAATDISPLVAATLAVWGLQEKGSEPEPVAPWVVVM